MMRLCVLGNSHVAALALGWRTLAAAHPDVEVTFFASPRDTMGELVVVDGALAGGNALSARMAEISGGRSRIEPDRYDRFLICGMRFGIKVALPTLARFWPESHRADPQRTPVSDDCFDATFRDLLRDTSAFQLAGRLRTITDRPVEIAPIAMPSEEALDGGDKYAQVQALVRSGDADLLAAAFRRAACALEGEGLTIRFQPDETLAQPLLTAGRYSRGSMRLTARFDSEHPQTDLEHMNGDYGAAVLAPLLQPRALAA